QQVPEIEILGNLAAERLSIVSFVIRRRDAGGRPGAYLHHNVVVALLNDLFGIQSRGGCSCAGPYGHRLLGIDLERSHAFEREISGGCEGIKPGWVRVNLNYFVSEAVVDYIAAAVTFVAREGWRLLGDYRFDPATGRWHHRAGPVEPPLRLSQVSYDPQTGAMHYPHHDEPVPESALAGYLVEAERIVAERGSGTPEDLPGPHAPVSADFEHLRWFELPAVCLHS
ncbi:MAG TPA: aminotransferase, partial [Microlunatus sp.]|nr:aminotransferase [Microlunatus sp.]